MLIDINTNNFLDWLKVKGLSDRTIKEYRQYYEQFEILNLTNEYLVQFIKLHNNCVARAFIKNLIEYIRQSTYPDDVKAFVRNLEIPKVSGRKKVRLPEVLTQEEVHGMAKIMPTHERLMLLVQFYGGLRVSELCSLKPHNFNWNYWTINPEMNGKLRLIYGVKGNKQRIVYVPQWVMKALYHWIKTSVSSVQSKETPLFRIKPNTWYKKVVKYSIIANVGKDIGTHTIRHSCATWLHDQNWTTRDIQVYLGHSSITSTQIYEHVSNEKLKTKFDRTIQ